MPYDKPEDLPESIREHLPPHGQAIYLKAFNNAWQEYADPKRRRGGRGREETAHRVAWAAVGQVYSRDADGAWRKQDD